jgi:hypothetical protein
MVIRTTNANAIVTANIIPRFGENSRHFGDNAYKSQGTETNNIQAGFEITNVVINGTSRPRLIK